jgi:uncharacterized protein YqjF (DUF2071 family)
MSTAVLPAEFRSALPVGLRHFAIVSYRVPVERLRPHIDPAFSIDTHTDGGRECGCVSVVMFLNDRIRALYAPRPRFSFLQTNYRAYVTYQERPGVWFFRIVQHSWIASLYRRALRVPAYSAPLRLDYDLDQASGLYRRYQVDCDSDPNRLSMTIEGSAEPVPAHEVFGPSEASVPFFTYRLDGYFYKTGSRQVAHLPVWHAPLQPQAGRVTQARLGVYEDLGIIEPEEALSTVSVLLAPELQMYAKPLSRLR